MESDPVNDLSIADIYEKYETRLHRFAYHLSQDPDQADDLVQETLIKAMSNIDLLNKLNEFQRRAWIYRVLKNKFLDQQRSSYRRKKMLTAIAELKIDADVNISQPNIIEILDMIPGLYRGVLEKKYLLGMTSAEISEELGIPASTVRSRLRLAAKWLQTHKSELI